MSCISGNIFKFSVYELLKFCHIFKSNTRYCVLHVATIILPWFVTFIRTYTHTHAHKHTHADLNFAIFWKDRQINTRVILTTLVRQI